MVGKMNIADCRGGVYSGCGAGITDFIFYGGCDCQTAGKSYLDAYFCGLSCRQAVDVGSVCAVVATVHGYFFKAVSFIE